MRCRNMHAAFSVCRQQHWKEHVKICLKHTSLAQQLKALTALAEDWGLAPRTHIKQPVIPTPGKPDSPSYLSANSLTST